MGQHIPIPAPILIPINHSDSLFPVRRIYCVGRNYAEHAKEMGFDARELPFFFMKPADAIVHIPEGTVGHMHYPPQTNNLHHEVELVIAIGKGGKNIQTSDAINHILGFAVGLDMTRRDLQFALRDKGRPWDVAKGFDESAPIGTITIKEALPMIQSANIQLTINQEIKQQSNTNQLIWSIAEIIEHLSGFFTLQPGDLIFTGTPAGVAPVVIGDQIHAEITGLASIQVNIVSPEPS
jgi:fumarylpyruvate hydrolase